MADQTGGPARDSSCLPVRLGGIKPQFQCLSQEMDVNPL